MLTATVLLLPEMSHNPLTLSQHWCLEQMPQPMEELATPLQALILITLAMLSVLDFSEPLHLQGRESKQ